MKNSLILCCSAFFIFACASSPKSETDPSSNENIDQMLSVETENSNEIKEDPNSIHKGYEEFYESGALKIEGDLDENQERNGLWIAYYEDGRKWSESFYVAGKKEGHSVTFYPNGKVRYVGEYKGDKMIGTWQFYNEEGEFDHEESFD